MEFTAIGTTVNLAARIEQLTKTLQVPILFSAETRSRLPATEAVRALEPQEIRGVEERMELYTLEST
jgi:adenylate cyclase